MTRRPTDHPLPLWRVLLAGTSSYPTDADWRDAGEVAAPDAADAAWQVARHIGSPFAVWVKGADGAPRWVEVATQAVPR